MYLGCVSAHLCVSMQHMSVNVGSTSLRKVSFLLVRVVRGSTTEKCRLDLGPGECVQMGCAGASPPHCSSPVPKTWREEAARKQVKPSTRKDFIARRTFPSGGNCGSRGWPAIWQFRSANIP